MHDVHAAHAQQLRLSLRDLRVQRVQRGPPRVPVPNQVRGQLDVQAGGDGDHAAGG